MKPGDLVTHPLSRDYFFVYADIDKMTADHPHFTVPEDTVGLLVELSYVGGTSRGTCPLPTGIGWINSVWLEPLDKETPP